MEGNLCHAKPLYVGGYMQIHQSETQKLLHRAVFLLLFVPLGAIQASALEKTLPIKLSFEAGQSKSARLQNVHDGSVISLAAQADCELWLDLKRKDTGERIFASKMAREWSTILLIADGGEHLLFFHNRSEQNCSFNGELTVRLEDQAGAPVKKQLKKLSQQLQKVFIMEPIDYRLVDCDASNSYAQGSKVLICRQHLEALQQSTTDRSKAEHLILFTLMHETSHVLLTQWQYPFNNNEDVVDEFAVVLTQLMKKNEAVISQADYFEQQPSKTEYEHILENNDRHTLSVQRARNLRGWAEDKTLLVRWMPVLIPHIRSDQLRSIDTAKSPELAQRIAVELESRSGPAPQ